MRTLSGLSFIVGTTGQRVADANSLDHEDLILEVHLAFGFSRKSPIACVDPARLQRATQGPGESTGGRGDDVIEGSGVVGILAGGGAVVLTHLVVGAEENRLRLSR